HIGNAFLFGSAILLIDQDEWAYMSENLNRSSWRTSSLAWMPAARGTIVRSWRTLREMKKTLIAPTAVYDVFGDGTVMLYPAHGHTPGHRVLLVRLPRSGPVLLSGDTWHIAELRERHLLPSNEHDKQQVAIYAMHEMVEELARSTGARLIQQHVPGDFS